MSHREHHPVPVESCFGCKVLSVNVGAGALENKGKAVREMSAKDTNLAADLDAYSRLRADGLQPKHIDGAKDLESKVGSQFDIDLGRFVPKNEESRVREGFAIAKELGFTESGLAE